MHFTYLFNCYIIKNAHMVVYLMANELGCAAHCNRWKWSPWARGPQHAEELATIVASNSVTIARDSAPPALLLFSFVFTLVRIVVYCLCLRYSYHYYKILFCEALKNELGGGHEKKLPRLIASINRGGHVWLTETVIENCLAKLINRDGYF